jgi:hypothetical protein
MKVSSKRVKPEYSYLYTLRFYLLLALPGSYPRVGGRHALLPAIIELRRMYVLISRVVY